MSCDCANNNNILDENFSPETNYKSQNNIQFGGDHSCDHQQSSLTKLDNCSLTQSETAWDNRYEQNGGVKNIMETTNNIEKIAVNLLTLKSENEIKDYVSNNMTSNVKKHMSKFINFMKTITKKKVEYGIFGLSDNSAKMFILSKGIMKNKFYRKNASNKTENLTCIADIKISPKTSKINDLKLKFEFLNKNGLSELRNLQKNILLKSTQTGGGYFIDVSNPIGKMPSFGSYLNCCPPVFKGNLIGGGVLQELVEPMTSVFAPGLYAIKGVKEGINVVQNFGKILKKIFGHFWQFFDNISYF